MLRSRSSRAMTTKQALMVDHGSQSSPTQNYKTPVQSFFGSPRFKAFTTKVLAEADRIAEISPTSILETSSFSPFGNPFWDHTNTPKSRKILAESKHSWEKLDSKGIGLALIDALTDKTIEENSSSKANNKVFFGTKLRVQIPCFPFSNLSPTQSPKSPADFGIKTKNSQFSPSGSAIFGTQTKDPAKVYTESLYANDIELSEDYTCVISHGPNPKTTHIYDNCIIESYCSSSDKPNHSVPENFLSFCYTCKKNLEQKNDIYIYRGEKAFCSQECRYQEMLLDEVEN